MLNRFAFVAASCIILAAGCTHRSTQATAHDANQVTNANSPAQTDVVPNVVVTVAQLVCFKSYDSLSALDAQPKGCGADTD